MQIMDNGILRDATKEEADEIAAHNAAIIVTSAETKKITQLAFRNRFTKNEKVALDMAGIDDPTASMAKRQLAASIRVAMADLAAASFVDLSRVDTQEDVKMLEAAGLLAPGRADVILNRAVQSAERYQGVA